MRFDDEVEWPRLNNEALIGLDLADRRVDLGLGRGQVGQVGQIVAQVAAGLGHLGLGRRLTGGGPTPRLPMARPVPSRWRWPRQC